VDDAFALEACRYVIARVQAEAGPRWRQGLRPHPFVCHSQAKEALLVAQRRLCGVPEAAARALSEWVAGRRPALCLRYAPTPRQVLALGARGLRPVSLLDSDRGLPFALHDLCHLEKFAAPAHYAGQVGLFALVDQVIDSSAWQQMEAGLDAEWPAHRDHVLSDMNGSPVYLYVVLKARLLEACTRAGVVPTEYMRQFAACLDMAEDGDHVALERYFSSVGREQLRTLALPEGPAH
jgi:hypothetical protein